jgi:hypothetical protein
MQDINGIKIEVVYKNDLEARNKFITYIINLIIDNNFIKGEPGDSGLSSNQKTGGRRYDN